MSEQALSRRERKKQQTRRALAAAALHLFAERGYEQTTIEDITEAVDVSQRTFFRYFDSKEEVALPDKSEILGRLRQALADRPADEPLWTSVREAILAFAAGFTEEELEVVLLRARLLASERALLARFLERQTVWEDILAAALAARLGVEPTADLRCRLVATTTIAALRAAFMTWLASGGRRDFQSLAAEALDQLEHGLGDALTSS